MENCEASFSSNRPAKGRRSESEGGATTCPRVPITDNREQRTDNSRASVRASVSGDDKNHCSHDDAENPEEGIDAAVKGSGVWIGSGRHGVCEGYLLSVI